MTEPIRPIPIELARQFTELCGMIVKPVASSEEQRIENTYGISMRVFSPGGSARAVPQEMAAALQEKARMLLDQSQGTVPYMEHVMDTIKEFTGGSGMVRMLGSDYIIAMAGINMKDGNAGMFDPQTAEDVELEALRIELENGGASFIPSLRQAHITKIEAWVPAYREKYGKDPISN